MEFISYALPIAGAAIAVFLAGFGSVSAQRDKPQMEC
jgi:hypothetical protein